MTLLNLYSYRVLSTKSGDATTARSPHTPSVFRNVNQKEAIYKTCHTGDNTCISRPFDARSTYLSDGYGTCSETHKACHETFYGHI
jgi:hypothetical protein